MLQLLLYTHEGNSLNYVKKGRSQNFKYTFIENYKPPTSLMNLKIKIWYLTKIFLYIELKWKKFV